MKKTGQLLREARESRRISLQEVSIHLKINSRILKALEDGDMEQLPAKTFLRGFVQSYAQFLRLDGTEVLELFQSEMGSTHPKTIIKASENTSESHNEVMIHNNEENEKEGFTAVAGSKVTSPHSVSTRTEEAVAALPIKKEEIIPVVQEPLVPSLSVDQKTWSRSMKIGTLTIIILIGAIIYGVIKTIEKYEREATIVKPESELEVLPRTEPEALSLPVSSEPPLQDGTAENKESMTNGEAVDLKTTEPEKVSSESASLTHSQSASVKAGEPLKPPAEASAVPPSPPPPVAAAPTGVTEVQNAEKKEAVVEPTPQSRPQEVIIEALDKVTIEYSIDDKAKATLVLSAEKVHTFRGDRKLSFSFSDGGSINIIHNGKDRGVPGHLGKPLQLKFPE